MLQFGKCGAQWGARLLPEEALRDEEVAGFVGQAAGVVARQTCSQLQMRQLMLDRVR